MINDQVLDTLAICRGQLKAAIEPVESTEWGSIDAWASEWRPWIRHMFPSELEDFDRLVSKPKFSYTGSLPRFDRSSIRYTREAERAAHERHQESAARSANNNRASSSQAKHNLLRLLDGLERLYGAIRGDSTEAEQLLATYSPSSLDSGEPIKVFLSYSHEDREEALSLEVHLSALKRQKLVETWHDGRIAPGEDWSAEIRKNLETSRVIVLLVSSSFLDSEYCYSHEMDLALERRKRGEAIVVPVLAKPCDWQGSPFASIQMLPTGSNPITAWSNRDAALADVARGIRLIVERMAFRR